MRKIIFLGVFFLLLTPFIWAQSPAAQVSGQIRDASGGVISGVLLEAHDQENGRIHSVSTDEKGQYEFLRLPPGNYEISASYRGFQSVEQKNLSLSAGQAVSLDLTLEVQDAEQSITVMGEVAPLDLSSPHLSSIINEVSLSSLPINGRSLDSLALLAPGMIPVRAKDTRALNGTTAEISGNGARGTDFLLDGMDIQHPILKSTPGGVSGVLLGMDSVQEFVVLNDAYPAYLGGSGGATVSIITRRGTRDFHGSLFEFHRTDNLDAANWADNRAASGKPEFKRNQFGGSIGGPLPGEENTFFFSYEALRERQGMTLSNTVPNDDTRAGFLPVFGPNGEPTGELEDVGVNT
ncbi:MAG: TonB-dependent receptor, partial [Acidobacteria bacterium]|nr:TonB-dependent receptor [Acidobacteriota bacterium]